MKTFAYGFACNVAGLIFGATHCWGCPGFVGFAFGSVAMLIALRMERVRRPQ